MGRTNPTYRDALRAIEERWSTYRRVLRRRDESRFDRLFAYAREHADATGVLNHHRPILPTLFSVDLEQERRLDEQAERIRAIEERLAGLEGRPHERGERASEADTRFGDVGCRTGDRVGGGERVDDRTEDRCDG